MNLGKENSRAREKTKYDQVNESDGKNGITHVRNKDKIQSNRHENDNITILINSSIANMNPIIISKMTHKGEIR